MTANRWPQATSPIPDSVQLHPEHGHESAARPRKSLEELPSPWCQTQTTEDAIDNLEAVVDELLIETGGLDRCHSVSTPALTLGRGQSHGCSKMLSAGASELLLHPLAGHQSPNFMAANVNSDLLSGISSASIARTNPLKSSAGSLSPFQSKLENPNGLTVNSLLSTPASSGHLSYHNAETFRPDACTMPPLYLITENNPEFDKSRAVTVIIDGECLRANVEEITLMRAPLSSPQVNLRLAQSQRLLSPALPNEDYKLTDILHMLQP